MDSSSNIETCDIKQANVLWTPPPLIDQLRQQLNYHVKEAAKLTRQIEFLEKNPIVNEYFKIENS